MVTCSISNDRMKPLFVTGFEPAAMIGVRSADTIRASGHNVPRQQAGHMTAPDQGAHHVAQNPCNAGAVHT